MRVLVCGSRDWTDVGRIERALRALPVGAVVLHGGARGADLIAGGIAHRLGLGVEVYPADWATHGKRAGIIRNLEMLDTNPDLVIAFWRNGSRGTAHTVREAERRGIPVEMHLSHP